MTAGSSRWGDAVRNRLLFEQHPDPMFELDADGRFVAVNAAFVELSGRPEAELLAMTYHPLVHPDDRERSVGELRAALAGQVRHYELRVGRPEAPRIVAATKLPVVVDGEVVAVYGIARDITRTRRTQAALVDSERRFRGLFEGAITGIAIVDGDGRFVDANPSFQHMLAYDLDQLRLLDVLSITHPDDRDGTAARMSEVFGGAVPHLQVEKRYLRRTGDIVWARVSISLIADTGGEPRHVAAIVEDITSAKAAAAGLRRSETLRRMAGQLALVGGWSVDPSDLTLYLSDEVLEILDGKLGQQQSLDQALTMYAPADRERVSRALDAVLTEGTPADIEAEIDTFIGRRIPVRVTAEAHRREDGSIQQVFGAIQDLTELRASSAALRQRERQLERQAALLDEAQDAIIVRDMQHRITYWNRSAERVYGWSADEVAGLDIRSLLYEELGPFDEAMRALRATGSWTGELRQRHRDGTPLVVDCRLSLVEDEDGQPETILAINTDVTAQRAVEQQLLRAQRMESLGTLASGIAHDLNNVLSPILLAAELLQLDDLTDVQSDLLRTVHSSARRGSDLVSQVLSFARGVEGVHIPVDVGQLLADVRAIIRDTFPKDIQVVLDVPADIGTITADSTQIQQVLLNLAVNARDAMPAGGQLTISASEVLLDGGRGGTSPPAATGPHLRIVVQDTGTGMAPDVRDRIFEPFFTTKPQGAGTGLGLSTAVAIVHSHGGHLQVHSDPGRGTSFHLFLPATAGTPVAPESDEQVAVPRGRGERVLVVDDEPAVRALTRQTLEAHGYRVLEATDGAEAATIFAAHRDDVAVVLTDMMMPVMDGTATIHALRRIDRDVKIIAASGLHQAGRQGRAAPAGVGWFLAKPFSSRDLLTTVAEAVADGA